MVHTTAIATGIAYATTRAAPEQFGVICTHILPKTKPMESSLRWQFFRNTFFFFAQVCPPQDRADYAVIAWLWSSRRLKGAVEIQEPDGEIFTKYDEIRRPMKSGIDCPVWKLNAATVWRVHLACSLQTYR